MDSSPSPRAVAARIVTAWRETGDFPDRMVDRVRADHAMVMDLSLGVVRWIRLLEFVCGALVQRKPRAEVEGFLLVGVYQLIVAQGMADHAAVNETVEAAKQDLGRNTADFINAVLRRAIRERDDIRAVIDRQPDGIRFSHPDTLLQRWFKQYGEEPSRKLCAWNNSPPETVLRINRGRVEADRFLGSLREAGVEATPHTFRPGDCFVLQRGVRVPDVPGYKEGWFAAQDPSTLLAPELLDAQPDDVVLDACAAPGGKTLVIAEQMQGKGVLMAMDRHEDRLEPLRENCKRMRQPWVKIVCEDATRAEGRFDRILLDVPCSNTGVLRRRADARWRFAEDRLASLVETQRALLDHAATLLKPGGSLVYSTCSLEPEENEELVAAWLKDRPGFALRRERRLFPPESGTDGTYAALLGKKDQ
ncbi:MAG: 16S rRNA (cytosine(967)-C(5))-methyltransferase RsmB [bacterium]